MMAETITEPGIYDLPDDVYHSDPVPGGSLSSSTAKKLLGPDSCPAIAKYERDHPVIKDAYDFGHLAHKLILGKGAEIAVRPLKGPDGRPWDDWKKPAAREWRDEQRAAGRIPTTPAELAAAERMAEAVRAHPAAGDLFLPGTGVAEQAIFWQDDRTGVWRRAMLDWLSLLPGLPPMIVDLKTIDDPSPTAISKSLYNHGYYQQAPYYQDAVRSLGYETPLFLFVFVGKSAPHIVTVVEPDPEDLDLGRRHNDQAIGVWATCQETGHWPGYSDEPLQVSMPAWTRRNQEYYA